MGGHMNDGVHYDVAKIRLFNSQNLSEHWIIPDHIAREYYQSDHIRKFTEVGLTKNSMTTGPTNTIRQLDICCGWHRLCWRPVHRTPQDQSGYYQPGYYGQPPSGGQGGPWYAPPNPGPGYGYGPPPGMQYPPGGTQAYPPPPGMYNHYSALPPLSLLLLDEVNGSYCTSIWVAY
jgi:hypothetical protein